MERKLTVPVVFLSAALLLAGCSAHSAFDSGLRGTVPDKHTETITVENEHMKTIYLAGGCFWGVQKYIDQFDGVIETETGYANGPTEDPSYRDVCASSGHAETVRVVYDETRLALDELLDYYFLVIDPLSVNQQGNDAGIQYRTGIYYTKEDQLPEIQAVYDQQQRKAGAPLAVEMKPLENFYPAEEYHQKYLDKNPGGYCHIPRSYFSLQQERDASATTASTAENNEH